LDDAFTSFLLMRFSAALLHNMPRLWTNNQWLIKPCSFRERHMRNGVSALNGLTAMPDFRSISYMIATSGPISTSPVNVVYSTKIMRPNS